MNRATVLACLFAALTTACATRGAVYQTAEDQRGLQAEVRALRQSQEDLSRRLSETTNANRAAQARTDQLQAEVAAVKAEVERLTAKVAASDEAIKGVKAPHAAALPVPEPPKQSRAGPETAFTAGLTNFRNREYGQAVLDFLDVVTRHRSHELASTAQYLTAEAYYLQHDYRQALVEFQRAIDWQRPHPKVPDALLKAGLCHSRLREPAQAQQAWRRVVGEFPEVPAAEEARALLDGRKSAPTARRP